MSPTHFLVTEKIVVIMALGQFLAKMMPKILFPCFLINIGFVVSNDSELIATTDCIRLGQNVTYECTTCIVNASFTSWNGSIMDPPGCTISLSHLSFFNEVVCNEGMVIGQGLAINNTCYTSLLTVLVTPQVNGGNVSCVVDDINSEQVLIDTTIINITTVPLPPNDVQLIAANASELVFNWSPPSGYFPLLTYHIEAKNCGTCPNLTTTNTTTCTDFSLPAMCTMKIYSEICGNLSSTMFDNTTVNLRVLNIPGNVMIVPHYSDSDSRLLKIETQFNTAEQYSITNKIDGSATGYEVTYFNPNTGSSCSSSSIRCRNKTCNHVFEISSSSCPPASDISVTVSATNKLGQGPAKNSTTFANGTNTFVDIKFSSSKGSIVCYFIDSNRQGIQRECNVILTYGVNCGQFLNCYSGVSNTDTIQTTPPIKIIDDVTKYCFSARVSNVNDTLGQTVVIDGTLNLIPICNGESISGVSAITTLVILVAAVLSKVY